MIGALRAEALKLRRSLVMLVLAVPPVMIAILSVLVRLSGNGPPDWTVYAMSTAAIWAYFLLPMTATGMTALLAQLEHSNGMWAHILAVRTPKWKIFTAKGVMAAVLMAVASIGVWTAIFISGHLANALAPADALAGEPGYLNAASLLAKMYLASLLLVAIQLTIALRFSSFALPVSVGIGGTFVAVAATSSKYGVYFPWLLPINMLASEATRAELALWIGGLGGGVMLIALVLWLSGRDWR